MRLTEVLAERGADRSDIVVDVTARTRGAEATELRLRVRVETSDASLDRRYELTSADCASAAELLAVSLDRFLRSFPQWAGPAPPKADPTSAPQHVEVLLTSAVYGLWHPFGVAGQLGALADMGTSGYGRFGASLRVRGSIPQAVGGGRFQQTALLGGISWRWRRLAWELRSELRGGALIVSGIGFQENHTDALPWWGGAVFGGRVLSWGSIGIEIAASPLRHRASTRDGLASEDIPQLRVGLAGSFALTPVKP